VKGPGLLLVEQRGAHDRLLGPAQPQRGARAGAPCPPGTGSSNSVGSATVFRAWPASEAEGWGARGWGARGEADGPEVGEADGAGGG
jgi:hypothetical protein